MVDVFIIGCKGIPARYGGFETFVDNLVSRQQSKSVRYHVACMSENKSKDNFYYHYAKCKNIYVPNIGPAKAILYDMKSLKWALNTVKENNLKNGYVYILGCTIGPLVNVYKEKFKKRGFQFYLNPDGHEWKRDKWSYPVKMYLKFSESSMIKNADLTICDSTTIKEYVDKDYSRFDPETKYISYGSDMIRSQLSFDDKKVRDFYKRVSAKEKNYYLVVGRFVPENNYETIIREFMKSKTTRDLIIVTNYKGSKFFKELEQKTGFKKDKRIKFVGTVYDAELLKYIREKAFAYIHGHSVGGTNPSLLEALGLTKLNLLYDIGFNREVANDSGLYWNKKSGSLSSLINKVDNFSDATKEEYFDKAMKIVKRRYSWKSIVSEYERLFTNKDF